MDGRCRLVVDATEEESVEKTANPFFAYCCSKGYFQAWRIDLVTGKTMYNFKGDTHFEELNRSSGSHVLRIEGNSFNLNDLSPQVSHVSVRCHSQIDSTAFDGFTRLRNLKALLFLQGHKSSFKQVPCHFFLSLQRLRALDLSHTHVSELPNSVGNVKSWRYLDISYTPIKRLPETLVCLTNMQTLKLIGCSNFLSLPKGMRNLVNLHHLDLDILRQLCSMPHGMGALTNLQTLSAFLVGVEDECSIRQLKNMDLLSGSFCISRLENVLTEAEAREACLSHKAQLKKLELRWSDSCDELGDIGDGKILSLLLPNANLEELKILCYGGLELPNWICDPALSKLVSITLFECENCLVLSSLGQLPSLKVLNLVEFHKLKVIDHNFRGDGITAFHKLERLTIENMYRLEEWKDIGDSDFPFLCKLMIKHYPKLQSLCTFSCLDALEYLEICHCPMLASCPEGILPATVQTFITEACPSISASLLRDGSRDRLKVAHVPNIWVHHQELSFIQRFTRGVREPCIPLLLKP